MRNTTFSVALTFTAWQRGFTLVELLVSLSVGSILMTLTVPAMNGMLNTQKAISATSALFAGLNLARSEAIKRNARAVLCKTANGVTCTPSGGWEQGWILFHDLNNNAVLDAGEEIVLQQGPASPGIRLRGNLPIANYVSYTPIGRAKLISGAFQAGTFTLCVESSAGTDVRQIVLSGTGRARSQKGTANDCS
jgi:type IV fimbrial biogenesis protein FimT